MNSNVKGARRGLAELYGLYRARVDNNVDPKGIGRVRVRVPSLHGIPETDGSLSTDELPWASYCSPSGGGYDHGSYIVPEIGDYVFVAFESGDASKPIYLGGSYGEGSTYNKMYGKVEDMTTYDESRCWESPSGKVETPSEGHSNSYPDCKIIYKSPKGALIQIDDTGGQEKISIIDRLGQVIEMSSPLDSSEFTRRQGDHLHGGGLTTSGTASITMKDSSGQVVVLSSTDGKDSSILLDSPSNNSSIRIDSNGVTIKGNLSVEGNISCSGTNPDHHSHK